MAADICVGPVMNCSKKLSPTRSQKKHYLQLDLQRVMSGGQYWSVDQSIVVK